MPNTIKNRPMEQIVSELVSLGLHPQGPTVIAFRDMLTRVDKTLTDLGEVQSKANVTGRQEKISDTLQNLSTSPTPALAGMFNSLGNVVDTSTDHLTDGTGSPIAGGKRGFQALDSNNRLSGSFRANPVNVSAVPISSTTLSNDGISTAISIAAFTAQFGDGTLSYNSGSVDPGSFGTWYIYFDDPFNGGAVTYQVSSTVQNQVAGNNRQLVGSITTVGGSAKTGGGNTGGTGGTRGGKGFVQQ